MIVDRRRAGVKMIYDAADGMHPGEFIGTIIRRLCDDPRFTSEQLAQVERRVGREAWDRAKRESNP